MKYIQLGKSGLQVPAVAVGCMRINNMAEKEVAAFVDTCLAEGANFFDHADIYGMGGSETVFGKATAHMRQKLLIQTKCGIIRGKMYDLSYEHIMRSVHESLKRLQTEYIDVLLLHRPDVLMEPEEVAKAFDELKATGKVRHFGVSNQNSYQMQLLQSCLDMPLCANQMQFSILHTPMLQSGVNVNMYNDSAVNRDGGVLDYCRLHSITVQAWSPMHKGNLLDGEKYPEVNGVLQELAQRYGVSKTTIAIAWILRHPAKIQPITGTTDLTRLRESFQATKIRLAREDWYKIFKAAGNGLP